MVWSTQPAEGRALEGHHEAIGLNPARSDGLKETDAD
jgi:hypothetical protein